MDEHDIVTVDDNASQYDTHKLAKMLLIAAGSWLVGRGVELGYEAIKNRNNKPNLEDNE
jgi:hypothetical protein